MNIGIIIPAYNEADQLPDVLTGVLRHMMRTRICVVDDGSSDNTAQIARQFKVHLIQHPFNRGKGEALKSGFQWAITQSLDGVFTLDGDGQHDPDRIPDFLSRMELTESEIVIGKRRFQLGRMPLDRIFSNRISSLITSLIAGISIPDSQCGYRLIHTSVLESIPLFTSRFETETEFLIRTASEGRRIGFCPICVYYNGEGSSIHRLSDTYRFCRMLIRILKEKLL